MKNIELFKAEENGSEIKENNSSVRIEGKRPDEIKVSRNIPLNSKRWR